MAGKSRRVASRQGELSRRRKRSQRGPSGIPAQPRVEQQNGSPVAVAAGAAVDAEATADEAQAAQPAVATAVAPAPRPAPQTAAQPRGQGRTRGERPTAYNYVGSELRRIAALSTVVLAALVALSFVI